MPLKVSVIADSVLPEPSLPKPVFTARIALQGNACRQQPQGEPTFDETHAGGEIRITLWQGAKPM